MKKVLFLDIDGVLNNDKTFGLPCAFHHVLTYLGRPLKKTDLNFDEANVAMLRNLIKDIGFDTIVISSMWRFGAEPVWFQEMLALYDIHIAVENIKFINMYDCEEVNDGMREEFIKLFLKTTDEKLFYIVLDDTKGHFSGGLPNVVFTTMKYGMTQKEYDECREIARRSGIIS